jgi:hypothetical protein
MLLSSFPDLPFVDTEWNGLVHDAAEKLEALPGA